MSKKIPYSALNALQEAVFILDGSRKILFANEIAETVFGKGYVGLDFVQAIRHPGCIKIVDGVINGETMPLEQISLELPVKALFDVQASMISKRRLIVSFRDVSDLSEAEQMRTDFVANVSHELRSPLTSLSGFIETLRGPAKNDKKAQERFLGLMDQEASRMVRLISDLLSLSKVQANLRIRPTGSADIVEIINQIKAILNDVAAKEEKQIVVEASAAELHLTGNADELTQVFQNLIENALKYGKRNSSVRVKINRVKNMPGIDGEAISVEIHDEGEGIEKHHLARLTERFYRVDTHRSRDKGGTGLGLAIVKHIVNHHRGRMHIESEVGVGSTFTVYLPVGD